MQDFYALYNKAIQIKSKYETLQSQLEAREEHKADLINQMEKKLQEQVIYEDAISYMKEIIDALSRSHIDHIEKLLNSAISTIFFDKDYRIEFEISELFSYVKSPIKFKSSSVNSSDCKSDKSSRVTSSSGNFS